MEIIKSKPEPMETISHMGMLGITYAHTRTWRKPITESEGRRVNIDFLHIRNHLSN